MEPENQTVETSTETPSWDESFFTNTGDLGRVFTVAFGVVVVLILVMLVFYLLKRKKDRETLQSFMDDEGKGGAGGGSGGYEDEDEVEVEDKYETPVSEEKGKKKLSSDVEDVKNTDEQAWLDKLRAGLSKTRNSLTLNLTNIFSKQPIINDSLLEQVHEVLYKADIGVETSDKLVGYLKSRYKNSDEKVSWETIKTGLKEVVTEIFPPDLPMHDATKPTVVLMVGVNGVGKTTTIGKLAAHYLAQNKKVLLCAGDTYRAAAAEQLSVWGERLGVEVIKQQAGSDPAAVAYDAVKAAMARKVDVLLIDTAGRLHNKKELMEELAKIERVIGKDLPGAPHETWLVIDATTGQNAMMQVRSFKELVDITGLIVTKLDGTAKGGVIIGVSDKFRIPIRYIGVGEKPSDLRQFSSSDYAETLFS
ncbi:MAG: signal recognition particle-docking protein FtsY [Oligoflexales bacterium]